MIGPPYDTCTASPYYEVQTRSGLVVKAVTHFLYSSSPDHAEAAGSKATSLSTDC